MPVVHPTVMPRDKSCRALARRLAMWGNRTTTTLSPFGVSETDRGERTERRVGSVADKGQRCERCVEAIEDRKATVTPLRGAAGRA